MALTWNGDQIKRRAATAAMQGIDATMALCVIDAKNNHPWRNQTGTLEGSINIYEYAHPVSNYVVGKWGSADVNYAIIMEFGGPPHIIRPQEKKALFWPGARHPVKLVRHPGSPPFPFLRPAADRNYPRLAALIQRAFARV